MAISNKQIKSSFLLSILLIIIVLFVAFSILVPKISSRVFPQRRQMLWNDFYSDIKSTNKIDAKEFWQFREFYSPGYFMFDRNGISDKDLSVSLATIGVHKSFLEQNLVFLKYNSQRISSIDILTDNASVDRIYKKISSMEDEGVMQGRNYILIKRSYENSLLIFILPEREMEKANGFFDYAEKDKELVKGKYWLNISLIRVD